MRKLVSMTIVLLMCTLHLFAQDKTVTGKVTDEKDGTPLFGVSVLVKGTTVGTTTGTDGTFKLSLPTTAKVLIFSLVDYETTEISISNKLSFDVSLTSSGKSLSEVVVVAYGTQKRESITGSISKIGAAQLGSRLT